jgi:hypothetical protein
MLQRTIVNRNSTVCDELRDLLPGYAIGAADDEEARYVESLLEVCPEARQELADYFAVTELFYSVVEPVEPPAALHNRLISELRARN